MFWPERGRAMPVAVLVLLLACLPAAASGADDGAPVFARDRLAIETRDGRRYDFEVELAVTPRQRAWGLMFRHSLGARQGMLFLFAREAPRAFWMKNTPLALDLLFLDRAGAIVSIAGGQPFDETPIPSGAPAAAVLEVVAGTAARLGLAPGDWVRHRAFAPQAAAP